MPLLFTVVNLTYYKFHKNDKFMSEFMYGRLLIQYKAN